MSENVQSKTDLRKCIQSVLRELDDVACHGMNARLLGRLRRFAAEGGYAALAAYMPIGREVDIRPLLDEWLADGKALYLPRYRRADSIYELVQVRNLSQETMTGRYGIREPSPTLPALEALPASTLWLIPGIGFEARRGVRLGRGGGYYDRLLNRYPGGFRVGIAWECQMKPQLPCEEQDVLMDAVLTEERVCICGDLKALR